MDTESGTSRLFLLELLADLDGQGMFITDVEMLVKAVNNMEVLTGKRVSVKAALEFM